MKNKVKRILTILSALCMVFGMSIPAMAKEEVNEPGVTLAEAKEIFVSILGSTIPTQ